MQIMTMTYQGKVGSEPKKVKFGYSIGVRAGYKKYNSEEWQNVWVNAYVAEKDGAGLTKGQPITIGGLVSGVEVKQNGDVVIMLRSAFVKGDNQGQHHKAPAPKSNLPAFQDDDIPF